MAQFRATLVLIGFLLLTGLSIPVQWLLSRLGLPWQRTFPRAYFRAVCGLIGIRINVTGRMAEDEALLLASNHTSYFDIVVLGAAGNVSFVSKSEVADWPLFGLMAKLARTVFVERDRRAKTGQHRDMIQARLRDGDSLVLFPEGTSSDGNRVLPFKSALIGAAAPSRTPRNGENGTPAPKNGDDPVPAQSKTAGPTEPQPFRVQPVSVAYTRLHGMPMGRYFRPFFAWYGDMDLVPHLWEAFCLGPFDVDIRFHEPVSSGDFDSRKAMTAFCEETVARGVEQALQGRSNLSWTAEKAGHGAGYRAAAPQDLPEGVVGAPAT